MRLSSSKGRDSGVVIWASCPMEGVDGDISGGGIDGGVNGRSMEEIEAAAKAVGY
jgi:hypothetical protein